MGALSSTKVRGIAARRKTGAPRDSLARVDLPGGSRGGDVGVRFRLFRYSRGVGSFGLGKVSMNGCRAKACVYPR